MLALLTGAGFTNLVLSIIYIIRQEGKLNVTNTNLTHLTEQLDDHVKNCPHVSEDRMKAVENDIKENREINTQQHSDIETRVGGRIGGVHTEVTKIRDLLMDFFKNNPKSK